MKKHRMFSVILIAVFVDVLLLLCGTVLAYMFRQTEYKDNQFIPTEVSCEVLEVTDSPLTQKSGIKVKNTGNIDAYLRVRLVSYWFDSEGNVVAKSSSVPEFDLAQGWIKGSDDTYYYQVPVAPNDQTSDLLSSSILLEEDENGYLQVVEVFAEAIQSKPVNAVTNSWKVSSDGNGKITNVP